MTASNDSSTLTAPAVSPAPSVRSWLAVEVAGLGLLFPLAQAGEIFPTSPLQTLAHVQPWFLGVANLRSSLYGVVDLGVFLGLKSDAGSVSTGHRDQARLLALNPELRVHCALWVDRLAGLRRLEDMEQVLVEGLRPAFAGPLWRDAQGREWQEIDLAALARTESFLSIASSTEASSNTSGT